MIKIIDNFFNQEDLNRVQDFALNNAYYTAKYYDGTIEKTKENFYGNRWHFDHDLNIKELFIRQSELKFNIKIKEIHSASGIDQRNLDTFRPHVDTNVGIQNVLVMISGPTAVTNGTVFYYGSVDNCILDMHVGFRENRALMFPSNKIHSAHVSNIPNLKRFTATLFLKDYEE
jgi:hypothetical protein